MSQARFFILFPNPDFRSPPKVNTFYSSVYTGWILYIHIFLKTGKMEISKNSNKCMITNA
jgi:hypothetical protein